MRLLLGITGILALIMSNGPLLPMDMQTAQLGTGVLHQALFGLDTVEALRRYAIGLTCTSKFQRLLDVSIYLLL